MSNFNAQLPFGKIKDEDVVDNPGDPLIYAEVKIGEGKLGWEGPEYPAPRHRDGTAQWELVTRKKESDDSGRNFRSTIIDEEKARTIFSYLSDGFWDYAE